MDVEAGLATAYPAVQGRVRGQFGDEEDGRGGEVVASWTVRRQVRREPALGGVAYGVGIVMRGGEERREAQVAHVRV
ncbi:hypothetical protein ACWIGY_10950 [Streptomyces anulatus]